MIIGTGIDIIEIERVKKAVKNARFIERVFTREEQVYCQARGAQAAASYAARFAAKEAVLKAFGTGLRKGSLQEISILNNALGAPAVFLTGYFDELAKEKKVGSIYVSLSHARQYAVAQVIFWGSEDK